MVSRAITSYGRVVTSYWVVMSYGHPIPSYSLVLDQLRQSGNQLLQGYNQLQQACGQLRTGYIKVEGGRSSTTPIPKKKFVIRGHQRRSGYLFEGCGSFDASGATYLKGVVPLVQVVG